MKNLNGLRQQSNSLQRSLSRDSRGLIALLLLFGSACSPVETTVTPTAVGSTQNLSKNSNQNPAPNQDKKVILTTFTVIADMAQQVAGDRAIIQSLTKIGAEVHGYEPTPSDLQRGQQADLILDNGLNLERWAEKFYGNLQNVPRVTLSQGVEVVNITQDEAAGKANPHAWMSPKAALIYVENIRKALVDLDPTNASSYNTNAANYSEKIKNLDQKLRETIATVPPEKRFIVSCEGAFSYLAKDYGLKELYLWAVNSDQQATPRQIQNVIEQVKSQQIPVVFCESTVSADAQKQVARETGAKFAGVFYVDSLTTPEGAAPTYLDLLTYNINTLVKGLKNSEQ
ncbi:MAG: metal ABC transporter substrate-binding protein [Coleofasciculaceae cyanobacterium SM2_1_6]|nr:metal ABC transporter substrate-binding protein [Coleofasciculaceae cyanobacterium SM2_1_6]